MALLKLPKKFDPYLGSPNRKPIYPYEIDWNHPLTRGLKFFNIFDNARPIDLVAESPPTGLAGNPQWSPQNGVDFSSDRLYYTTSKTPLEGLSVAARVNPDTTSGNQYYINWYDATTLFGLIFWQQGSTLFCSW